MAGIAAPNFRGWRRENGRLGVRNHVVVLSVDPVSDAAAGIIARSAPAVVPLAGDFAGLSADRGAHLRALVGMGSNPNVAAAIVLADDPGEREGVADRIARTGKPVATFDPGGFDEAVRAAQGFAQRAAALEKEEASIDDLWISAKCEESDATTALASCPAVGAMYDKLVPRGLHGVVGETPELVGIADLVASRAENPEASQKWYRVWKVCSEAMIAEQRAPGARRQPTAANITRGISTIEEKGLSSFAKFGRQCRFVDVLQPAEMPSAGPGLYYMDTSSEAECVAQMAAAGFVIHLLPSGEPCALASPIAPLIQISGNPRSLQRAPGLIDLDLSGVLRGALAVDEAGELLIDLICRIAGGQLTAAERMIRS